MHVVPFSERERYRAKLDVQMENLKILVDRADASNGDLELISATLESLGRSEVKAAQVPAVRDAECAALNAATIAAATGLQEAVAAVHLMRPRAGVIPSQSEWRDLAHRLALADAAFRVVAVIARRCHLLARLPRL